MEEETRILSARSTSLRVLALCNSVITIEEALAMPGAFGALMISPVDYFAGVFLTPYPVSLCFEEQSAAQVRRAVAELAHIGRFLADHPALPWVTGRPLGPQHLTWRLADGTGPLLDELSGLGIAATLATFQELAWGDRIELAGEIANLPLPPGFREVFREWAEEQVNFVEVIDE